jgi:hypothetical protein
MSSTASKQAQERKHSRPQLPHILAAAVHPLLSPPLRFALNPRIPLLLGVLHVILHAERKVLFLYPAVCHLSVAV